MLLYFLILTGFCVYVCVYGRLKIAYSLNRFSYFCFFVLSTRRHLITPANIPVVPRDAVGNYRTARNRLNGIWTVNRGPGPPTVCVVTPNPPAPTTDCAKITFMTRPGFCAYRCIQLFFSFSFASAPHRHDHR